MDELFYCGFNGFRQVPYQPDKQTITSLISQCGKTFTTPGADKSNKVSMFLLFSSTKYNTIRYRNPL